MPLINWSGSPYGDTKDPPNVRLRRAAQAMKKAAVSVARSSELERQSRNSAASFNNETQYGPRGERYTEGTTKEGRPYRRYS